MPSRAFETYFAKFVNLQSCLLKKNQLGFPFKFSQNLITTGKEKLEQPPCERFLQGLEFSRAFLHPVLHEIKRGKFQKPVKIAPKAVVLI